VPHLLASAIAQLLLVARHSTVAPRHPADHSISMLPLEIVLVVIGIVIGRLWGRRAGLKHLGASEFKSRWGAVRKQRPW
jgi:hypothetical protein